MRHVGVKYDLPNGQKLYDALQRGAMPIHERSGAKQISFGAVIQLANAATRTINTTISNREDHLEPVPVEFGNLPEAFRRLMFVVFNGEEADDARTEEMALEVRFQAIDLLAEVMSARLDKDRKVGRVAIRSSSRGRLPDTGHTFWKRWRPGYGAIG